MKRILISIVLPALCLVIFRKPLISSMPETVPAPVIENMMVSCGPASADGITLDGKWFLQAILPSDTAAGILPTLIFNSKQNSFSGNTGCNNISGQFRLTDTTLIFNDQYRITKKLCTGYNEKAFLKSLLSTNRYELTDTMLILKFNETELSRWTRKPTKPVLIKTT